MQELLKQFEERQDKYERLAEEHRLHVSTFLVAVVVSVVVVLINLFT